MPLAAVALDSLFPYDVNASGRGHRTTDGASLLGHKSMVGLGIDRDAMRVGTGRKIVQPKVRAGIDDAHDRTGEHVARGEIVSVIARVVPDLVYTTHVIDAGDDRAGCAVDDILIGREGFAVVVRAADQEIIPRTLSEAGRHAVWGWESVNNHWPVGIAWPGINFIDSADGEVARSI